MSSADVSPCPTPSGTPLGMNSTHAPKYGTVIPNRIFVGGIAANVSSLTTEAELKQFFSAYGAVKDSKIIADRAGVSKGYGFITFENQEDAEKIIKKESDNLVFKDRKLNIGPAIRKQQVLPRTFGGTPTESIHKLESPLTPRLELTDPNIPPGAVMFSNGVPYTYHNGMAIFHAPEGGGYPIAQPQHPAYSTAMMMPQTPTMYVTPQYSAYQSALSQSTMSSMSQWPAAPGQWRWAPQQSPGQALTASAPGYVFASMPTSPELMYAQHPPHAYQPTELGDAAMLEGPPVEGSVVPMDLAGVNRGYATDVMSAYEQPPPMTTMIPLHSATQTVAPLSTKPASISTYKKPITTIPPRRTFSSPTILVKHGNKVQRVMVPKGYPSAAHMTQLLKSPDHVYGDACEGVPTSNPLTPPPTPDSK